MLTIRLQRTGKKNAADFRIVLAEKEKPVNKKFVEVLGSYNPRKKAFQVKEDRVKYWMEQRVEMSPTVQNLFSTNGLHTLGKVKSFTTPKKPAEPVAVETAPATTTETPTEVAEATAEMEAKVEEATSSAAEAPNSAEASSDKPADKPEAAPAAEAPVVSETPAA